MGGLIRLMYRILSILALANAATRGPGAVVRNRGKRMLIRGVGRLF